MLLRNSERTSFLRCRWRWNVIWNQKRRSKRHQPALTFGDLVHRSLEPYYIPGRKRGPHPAQTFLTLYDEFAEANFNFTIRDTDSENEEVLKRLSARDLGEEMLTNYVDEYGPEKHIRIIAPEMPFKVNLHNPKTGKYVVTAVGKLDAAYQNMETGRYGIIDHKTASSINLEKYKRDEQAGTYFALGPTYLRSIGVLSEDEKFDHILFNILRKAKKDTRPENAQGFKLNKNGSVSKNQPAKLFKRHPVIRSEEESNEMIKRIIYQAWEIEQVKKGKLPIYKRMTDTCGRCEIADICEIHESGGDWKEVMDLETVPWEPLADHELERKE